MKGNVIISGIPDAAVAERVTAFICAHSAKATPDQVRARLTRLPFVLTTAIDTAKGERLAASLSGLGAGAAFVRDELPPARPVAALVEQLPAEPPAVAAAETHSPRRELSPRRPREPVAPPDPEAIKLRDRRECRITLVFALLACLVAVLSPYFQLFAVPMALYAAHRATTLLDTDIWTRGGVLFIIFIPLANLPVLALLILLIHLKLQRSGKAAASEQDELAQIRLFFRGGFAALMALFLVATANGYLPEDLDDMRETVERRLTKEVDRSSKQLPRQVDKNLRIDRMTCGPDKRLTFHCTLLNFQGARLDPERFRSGVSSKVTEQVCQAKELQYFLSKEVVIAYAFCGNDGQHIATVDVSHADCSK